jgi:hypothetical protein
VRNAGLFMLLRLPHLVARVLLDHAMRAQARASARAVKSGGRAAPLAVQRQIAVRTLVRAMLAPSVSAPLLLLVTFALSYAWVVLEAEAAADYDVTGLVPAGQPVRPWLPDDDECACACGYLGEGVSLPGGGGGSVWQALPDAM